MASGRRSTRRSSSAQRGDKSRKRSRTDSTPSRRSKRGKSADRLQPEHESGYEPSETIPEGNEHGIEETKVDEDFPGDEPVASLDQATFGGPGVSEVSGSEGLRLRRRNPGDSGSATTRSVDLPHPNVWLGRWQRCKAFILPVFLVMALFILFIAVINTNATVGPDVKSVYSKLQVEMNSRTEQMRSSNEKRIAELEQDVKQRQAKHQAETLDALKKEKDKLTKKAGQRVLMEAINSEKFKKTLDILIDARLKESHDKIMADMDEAYAKIENVEKQIGDGESSIIEARKKMEKSATQIRNQCIKDIQSKKSELTKLIEKKMASAGGYSNEEQLKIWIESNLAPIVDQLIQEDLEKYSADRTGLVDYALRAAGGKIVAHSKTERSIVPRTNILKYFQSKKVEAQPPVRAIMPGTSWGQSWAMHGNEGFLLIKLSKVITPTKLSLEHISHLINPNPGATPKHFKVYGTNSTSEKTDVSTHDSLCRPREHCKYTKNERSLQQFNLTPKSRYQYIYFQILDNYGGNYTTIYRVRVHGNP